MLSLYRSASRCVCERLAAAVKFVASTSHSTKLNDRFTSCSPWYVSTWQKTSKSTIQWSKIWFGPCANIIVDVDRALAGFAHRIVLTIVYLSPCYVLGCSYRMSILTKPSSSKTRQIRICCLWRCRLSLYIKVPHGATVRQTPSVPCDQKRFCRSVWYNLRCFEGTASNATLSRHKIRFHCHNRISQDTYTRLWAICVRARHGCRCWAQSVYL